MGGCEGNGYLLRSAINELGIGCAGGVKGGLFYVAVLDVIKTSIFV